MADDLSRDAAIEYRAERADELLRQYVDQIFVCYRTDDPFDWLKAGCLFRRFKAAALGAGYTQADFEEHHGNTVAGGLH